MDLWSFIFPRWRPQWLGLHPTLWQCLSARDVRPTATAVRLYSPISCDSCIKMQFCTVFFRCKLRFHTILHTKQAEPEKTKNKQKKKKKKKKREIARKKKKTVKFFITAMWIPVIVQKKVLKKKKRFFWRFFFGNYQKYISSNIYQK